MSRFLVVLFGVLVSLVQPGCAAPPASVSALAFSTDGTLFVGGSDGTVERWRVAPKSGRIFRKATRDGAIESIVVSPDGQFIATVVATGVRLYDADMTDTAGFLPRAVRPLAFGPTGSVLAARAGKRGLSLWGMQRGRMTVIATLLADQKICDVSADGYTVATAKGDWEVRLWSLQSGTPKLLNTVKSHGWGGISGARLSPDGRLLLALGSTTAKPPDAFARVFDAKTGKEVGYHVVGTNVSSATVSADGRVLAISGSVEGMGALTVADLKTGKAWSLNAFNEGTEKVGDISRMALSHDGRWLVTAGAEGVRVWDTSSGKVVSTLLTGTSPRDLRTAAAPANAVGDDGGSTDDEKGEAPEREKVDALFAPLSGSDAPGGAVVVVADGSPVLEAAYGLANLQSKAVVTPKNLFHLGSIGKQFTALAIVMLAEDGKLDYDDSIGKHLPELARFGEGLTIRHLLHHTSGIADYDEDEALHDAIEKRASRPSNADLVAVLARQGKTLFAPGTRFKYSNTGYDVLGALVERLSGTTYAAFLKKRVFDPVGMRSTFAQPDARAQGPLVCMSYSMKGGTPNAERSHPFDNLNGSGSVFSTVGDLALYDRAFFGGQLVSEAARTEMFTPGRLNDGSSTRYGFGWEIESHGSRPTIGHSGSWLAFDNQYLHFPEQKLSVIVLLNQEHDSPRSGELAEAVADIFLDR